MRNSSITRQIQTSQEQFISRLLESALFGVCCEANFLTDENVMTGKGANSTISRVHYFFECHGLGKSKALHADNCEGQNQNSAFLWYYLWRVMTGLHRAVNYDFFIPEHTKFAPDWC